MLITDYSKIAENYDKNKARHKIQFDPLIKDMYEQDNNDFTVLDLSCGTGNYLAKQIFEYQKPHYRIKWIGIDKSKDMLKVAQTKKIDAKLILADAMDIPLKNNSVNYINNRNAFHHYTDKEKAIAEMHRILKHKGKIYSENASHEYVKYSWLYKYFPNAKEIDKERKPQISDYYMMFENCGFKVKLEVLITTKKCLYENIIDVVLNKDMSQLQLLTEQEYKDGLNKIIKDSVHKYLFVDFALLKIICEKI